VRIPKYLNPKWLIFGPLALLLIVAVACRDDEVTAPAPGLDTAAISSAVEAAVTAAVANIPAAEAPEVDTAGLRAAVEAAVAASVPEGTSASEIQSVVAAAVAAGVQPGASKEDVAALVASAVAQSTAGQAEGLSADEVQAVVERALAAAEPAAPEEEEAIVVAVLPTPTSRPAAVVKPKAPEEGSMTPGVKPVPMKGNLVDAIALAAKYGETPKYGGTLKNAGLAAFSSHDIHQSSGLNVMAMGPLYSGLLITNPYVSTEVMPDLAHSWEISEDGQTFTFHLHDGVTWHDGTPFTAEDVVWNVLRIYHRGKIGPNVDGNIGNFKYTMWHALMEPPDADGNDVGITAPDPNTVVFKALFPSPLVLLLFGAVTASILPRHIGEDDPVNGIWEMRKPIGTGAFRLTEEPTTQLWKFERNPEHFKTQTPYVDLLESHLILDQQTRATAVLTERIHWNNPTTYSAIDYPLAKAMAEQDPGIVWESIPNYLFESFAPENTREPFDDIRVRQAFSHALERGMFLNEYEGKEGLGSLQGAIGTSQFPGGAWAPSRELRDTYIGYWPDMEKRQGEARRLLAEYEAEKGVIDWESKPFQCFFDSQSCGNAVIIQALMKKVGVNIVIEEGSAANLWGKMVAGDHWMSQYSGAADFEDPTDTFGKSFVTGADFGFHHGWDEEIDDMFNQQKFLTDFDERLKIVQRMDEIAMTNSRLLMLYWQVSEKLRRDYVKGVRQSPSYWGISANFRMEYVWLDLPGARDSM
jgi:ABC-type transport system substrate-binding protein